MQITRRMSPNRSIGRQGWRPDVIVCHITEGSFDGTISWILNTKSQVSYHFIVARNGKVVQTVDISNTAWANGTTRNGDNRDSQYSPLHTVRDRGVNANLYTVSIGFEGRFAQTQGSLTPEQLKTAIWLIPHIREEIHRLYSVRGVLFPLDRNHIVGHHEVTPRTRPNCPGLEFPFDAIVQLLYNTPSEALEPEEPSLPLNDTVPTDTVQLSSGSHPSEWAREAWEWGFQNNLTDGTNPQEMPTREQVMQILFNYHKSIMYPLFVES